MNVLIVDDQASQRSMVRHLVEGIGPEVTVSDFADPVAALMWSQKVPPDLLLLDYRMPKMDGLEFARRFRKPLSHRDVPIVLITVVGDEPIRNAALEAGVIDFLVKPIRPRELRNRCRNLLELRQHAQSHKHRAFALERRLLGSLHELEDRERELLARLVRLGNARAPGRGAGAERMGRYAGLVGEGIGLPDEDVRVLEGACALHDIGELALPDGLLLKPGAYSADERKAMQAHTTLGHAMLHDSHSRFITAGAAIALGHHERFDGSGYPQGLAGTAIPVFARIAAIADVLSALTTPRADRPALALDAALAAIEAGAGGLFDPAMVEVLLGQRARVEEIHAALAPGAPGLADAEGPPAP